MKRKPLTKLQRAKLFLEHEGKCHLCGHKINAQHEKWQVEHIIALTIGGDDDVHNMAPAHVDCHKEKTKADVKAGAKIKRIHAKHIGAKPPSQWPKRKMNPPRYDNTKHIEQDTQS